MKKFQMLYGCLFLAFLLMAAPAVGQRNFKRIKGNGHVIRSSQSLPEFTKIKASGIDRIYILTKGNDPYTLVIETDDNLVKEIQAKVVDNTLSFTHRNLNPTKLKFYVTVPTLAGITASGASEVRSVDTLQGKQLVLNTSGAADVNLMLNYKKVQLTSSGAADMLLSGKSKSLNVVASGAADVKAGKLEVDSVFAKASGASNIRINALKYLNKNISGVANIKLASLYLKTVSIKTNNNAANVVVIGDNGRFGRRNDTTRVVVGSLNLEVVDGDTTKVSVGGHTLTVDDHGNVKWKNRRSTKFNGHWGGVELGINGFVNHKGNADLGSQYDFLNLQYEKSINVNINLFEKNIALNKAKTIGLVSGIGFSFNNYRFANPTYLSTDQNMLSGFYMRNVSINKSKLSVYYLNVPLILEFQTNNPRRNHRFHFGMGVIVNARIRSHSKIYFNEANKQYFLENPATGELEPGYFTTPNRSNRNIVKSINSFNLNPFLVSVTLRAGYGNISLFANMGITPMFQKAQGPELYQWSAGISLVGW